MALIVLTSDGTTLPPDDSWLLISRVVKQGDHCSMEDDVYE